MYCSKCGEADQDVNSYCRKCGSFLISNKTIFLILITNTCLFISSLSLLVNYLYLSEETFKELINLNYIMVGLNLFTQILNIYSLIYLLRKIIKNSSNAHVTSEGKPTELNNVETKNLLTPAVIQSVIPSVVEQTTRNLEKVRRT